MRANRQFLFCIAQDQVVTMSESPSLPLSVIALHRGSAAHGECNPGVPFDAGWFDSLRVNASAVERRTSTLATRRTVKKDAQAAWLLKAITCIDLTTLNGDDTEGRVRRLARRRAIPCATTFWKRLAWRPPASRQAPCVSITASSQRLSTHSRAAAFRSRPCPRAFPQAHAA